VNLNTNSGPASARNSTDLDQLMQARGVADRFDITVRTLDRWLQKPHLAFPRPAMVTHDISGRVRARFWRVADLAAWESQQAARIHTNA
jgi:hypothetical protein